MERAEIERIFEAYFEKYKKTEGDHSSWSAFWTEITPAGALELNLTKCPKGTTFKIFVDKHKVAEVVGWDAYFQTVQTLVAERPGLYDEDRIFGEMAFVI